MSTHESPRHAGRSFWTDAGAMDRQTTELLLDGHGPAGPLADLLAAANAPGRPRELRGELEALRVFSSHASAHASAAQHGTAGAPASERLSARMSRRRRAIADALRPVPLAKGLLATTVAVTAAFAVGSAVTGPAGPVDSTSPAALELAGVTTTTTTTTTTQPSSTTTSATRTRPAGPTRTTARPARPAVKPPAECVEVWRWMKQRRATATAPPSAAADRPDRETFRTCYAWWKKHRQKGFPLDEDRSGARSVWPGFEDERADRADRAGRSGRRADHRAARWDDRRDNQRDNPRGERPGERRGERPDERGRHWYGPPRAGGWSGAESRGSESGPSS